MDQKLRHKIVKRKEEGTLRSLSSFSGYTDFFSNDYLGLSKVEIPTEEAQHSGTGSRLISGNHTAAIDSERVLAQFFNAESSLMFNSGYDANLGFFGAVPQRGDTVIYDEYIHASIRDGIRLSLADSFSFKHNNVIDLESKIKKAKGVVYIAVESLYSMDGDIAPLKLINELAISNEAYLIVDEAHAGGVFGEKGRGIVNELGLEDQIFARLITFGKAFGSHGGMILGSFELIEFLVNFARSFIYTTALPPETYNRSALIIQYLDNDERRAKLLENISFFRSQLNANALVSDERSPIQALFLGEGVKINRVAQKIQEDGIAVKPIFAPTVPAGKERLRICIHSNNTEEEIMKLTKLLKD